MKLTKISLFLASFGALIAGFGSAAIADSTTATFPVTANVKAHCIISADGVVFSDYDPTAPTATDASTPGAIKIHCSKGSAVTIGLDHGTGNPAGGTQNIMKSPTKTTSALHYQLFQPATGSTPGAQWNDSYFGGSGSGVVLTHTSASNALTTFAIPGKIPAGENVDVADDYADSVIATINF
jgi:spore coat protein U-like protein